jgi:glycosyltransferase involved in cell wall biosynthesis
MADSVHVARWIDSVSDLPLDIVLISSSPNRRVHSGIKKHKNGTGQVTVKVPLVSRFLSIPLWALDSPNLFSGYLRGFVIAYFVRRVNPSAIHVMESQNGGYAYLRARKLSSRISKLPMLLTLFGSDLYWFSSISFHEARLRELLPAADALATEGRRDRDLAAKLGFNGRYLTSLPVSGGILDSEFFSLDSAELSTRNTIAVKGYSNSLGCGERALVALGAILPKPPHPWRVEVFSAEGRALKEAKRLKKAGHDVRIFKKHQLAHSEVLALFRRSRVFLGISRSDGLPATLLESMSQGTFPIQSNTSMAEEWIEQGVTGFLVDPDSPESIKDALERSLRDDQLVESATRANLAKVRASASNSSLRLILSSEFASFVGLKGY